MPYQFGDPGWLLVAALVAVLAAFLLALPALGLVAGKARAWRRAADRAMATARAATEELDRALRATQERTREREAYRAQWQAARALLTQTQASLDAAQRRALAYSRGFLNSSFRPIPSV